MNTPLPSPLQLISDHPGSAAGIRLYIKRDDLLHPSIAGNKWRKLEPLIPLIQSGRFRGILSYGGPFSNHLQALAAAGKAYGFPTVGIVRGLAANFSNATLAQARADGMQLMPISKQAYAARDHEEWQREITVRYPDFYALPEGGATALAVENCQGIAAEILTQLPPGPTPALTVCLPAGTGCTAAGVIAGLGPAGTVRIFPAADHGIDEAGILHFLPPGQGAAAFEIIRDYTFGGFAVFRPELIGFIRRFQTETGILLDPVYTSKMMFGVHELLAKNAFLPESTVVALHTGGLQGWAGFQERFGTFPGQW